MQNKRWVSLKGIIHWTGKHHGFVVQAYFENICSVIATQWAVRRRFNICCTYSVPGAKTIWLWIMCLQTTGSMLKRRTHCSLRTVRTSEHVQQVRTSIEQSPRCSACKHAVALGISSPSLRRILHFNLKFHPYKIMLAQKVTARDYASHSNACEQMVQQLFSSVVARLIPTWLELLTSKTSAIGLNTTPRNITNDLSTLLKSWFGAQLEILEWLALTFWGGRWDSDCTA